MVAQVAWAAADAMGVILGFILLVLGVPLVMGKVRPNAFYGFRTAATMRDERVWYEANAFGGMALIGCGATVVALAFLLKPLSHGLSYGDYKLVEGAFQAGPLLVMAIALVRYNARLK